MFKQVFWVFIIENQTHLFFLLTFGISQMYYISFFFLLKEAGKSKEESWDIFLIKRKEVCSQLAV